jgi:hypothetical protein
VLFDGSYNQRTVMLPVLEGESATLEVAWIDHTRELVLEYPKGAAPKRAFGDKKPKRKTERADWKVIEADGKPCRNRRCEPVEWSNPLRAIACKDGQVASGALRRCATLCSASTPCATGSCQPWPTGDFCGVP